MGLGFVVLLYGFVYVALVLVLWTVAWPFRLWLRTGPKLTSALRVAPFIGAAIPPAAFVAAMVWDNFAPPDFVYRAVFGRLPDSAITALHGQSNATNDAREVFLSFRDADAAFSRTFSSARFERADVAKSNVLVPMPGDTPPHWWDGRALPGSRSLRREQRARLGPDRHDPMPQRRNDLRSGAMDQLTGWLAVFWKSAATTLLRPMSGGKTLLGSYSVDVVFGRELRLCRPSEF
ncbi:hypothetical protein ACQR1N_16820 [Bradyrhizobium sp. HKCCYLRH1073]|uniref:hypothetical protein n=1 Tax=unclassified Bradyrhizobium TaxID=2631580 RepID=UPI003EB8B6EB